MKIQAPVQHLVLRGSGVEPTIPDPYTLVSGDVDFNDNINIMVAQFALNVDDNLWYYRGKDRIYKINLVVDDVTLGENSGIEVFKSDKAYLAGDTYVSFASITTGFTEEAIYRCIEDTIIGESPETTPLKWEKQSEDFTIKSLKISDIDGLETRLSDIEKNNSKLYKQSLTSITTSITIPDQGTTDYYVEIVKYTVGSYTANNMIEVSTGQTATSFTVVSEPDYEIGELIYRIQKFN